MVSFPEAEAQMKPLICFLASVNKDRTRELKTHLPNGWALKWLTTIPFPPDAFAPSLVIGKGVVNRGEMADFIRHLMARAKETGATKKMDKRFLKSVADLLKWAEGEDGTVTVGYPLVFEERYMGGF